MDRICPLVEGAGIKWKRKYVCTCVQYGARGVERLDSSS